MIKATLEPRYLFITSISLCQIQHLDMILAFFLAFVCFLVEVLPK